VRHVRMLALGLVAVFTICAMAATTALAHEPGELTGKWKVFKECPYNSPEVLKAEEEEANGVGQAPVVCFVGQTAGGAGGGHFSLGRVSVPLSKKITLQGAAVARCEEAGGPFEGCTNLEGFEGKIVVPPNVEETLLSPELTVPDGLKYLSSSVQTNAKWPQALKESFQAAKGKKELGLKVKIEVAGRNRLYEEKNGLSEQNLIEQERAAFELPLKVSLHSPWLTSLGSGQCEVGTDEHPVVQHLTDGTSGGLKGEFGELHFFEEFALVEVANNTLVDNTWPVEVPVVGCGGATYESYVDDALSKVLGVPSAAGAGQTILTGTLYSGDAKFVRRNAETGEKI
jgi:hypothetical protein